MTNLKTPTLADEVAHILHACEVDQRHYTSGERIVLSPISGDHIARVSDATADQTEAAIRHAHAAFLIWRRVPAPRRGEFVRLLGEELRVAKEMLGRLVSIEVGKVTSEGMGEVQEMIDICDFAVGLSRQLYGKTMGSERPNHRMMEQWHPAGVVGVISAFNFPVAVWSWNAALAFVCGNSVVWKPSEKTPLTALAVTGLVNRVISKFDGAPAGLAPLIIGARPTGELLTAHPLVPVVSATGSSEMGRAVAQTVAARFGRAILELGGNNATIVCASADLELALQAVAFGAIGTAGQRCTTLRRLFVHADIYDKLLPRLHAIYSSVRVGNPLQADVLVGPLIDSASLEKMQQALAMARADGGLVYGGERIVDDELGAGIYVRPAIVEMSRQTLTMYSETFAPILYVMRYNSLDEAIELHNAVPQGLSSSIFTNDLREAERFMSATGSDCGIVNVNMGPSGAEIGGAFGGEKETGGGRESGSDAWKGYMRRMTSAVNYGSTMPLAQGVRFDVEET